MTVFSTKRPFSVDVFGFRCRFGRALLISFDKLGVGISPVKTVWRIL